MASSLFSLGSLLAVLGWLVLLVALAAAPVRARLVAGVRFLIPALLGVAYIGLIVAGRDAFHDGGFSSIAQVRALFANDDALTAGWLHYLAFDLFVGAWIVEDAGTRKVWRLLVVPCLILVFLFGPCGYLLYMGLRLMRGQAKAVQS